MGYKLILHIPDDFEIYNVNNNFEIIGYDSCEITKNLNIDYSNNNITILSGTLYKN